MAYSTTLTVDLQDTQSVPESYSVEFNVLSTMYIVGVYTNKTRIIIVEGMYCCIATWWIIHCLKSFFCQP